MARVHHVRDLALVSKENKRKCTSQHTHIPIVEVEYRLHGKTRIFFFFVRYREWLKLIHVYVLWDRELGPEMSSFNQ